MYDLYEEGASDSDIVATSQSANLHEWRVSNAKCVAQRQHD
jgi:hypothetical protein